MTRYGLFIDYEYCSGCKVCVTACKMEHGFEPNDFGIVLLQAAKLGLQVFEREVVVGHDVADTGDG